MLNPRCRVSRLRPLPSAFTTQISYGPSSGFLARTKASRCPRAHVRFVDGSTIDVDAVVWATGYRSDYSWIEVPVFDEHGAPQHRRGVTGSHGLYFLGMHGQYSRGSSLIHWV